MEESPKNKVSPTSQQNHSPKKTHKEESGAPLPRDGSLEGIEADQMAIFASGVTTEMAGLVEQLRGILEGFKDTVESGGQSLDAPLGKSLGGILASVEQAESDMEKIAHYSLAMSTVRLGQMAEVLRLEVRDLIKPKFSTGDPV